MRRLLLIFLTGLTLFTVGLQAVQAAAEVTPTESECQPYIDDAISKLKGDSKDELLNTSGEDSSTEGDSNEGTDAPGSKEDNDDGSSEVEVNNESKEDKSNEDNNNSADSKEDNDTVENVVDNNDTTEDNDSKESKEDTDNKTDEENNSIENNTNEEDTQENDSAENQTAEDMEQKDESNQSGEKPGSDGDENDSNENDNDTKEDNNDTKENNDDSKEDDIDTKEDDDDTKEEVNDTKEDDNDSKEDNNQTKENDTNEADVSKEDEKTMENDDTTENNSDEDTKETDNDSKEDNNEQADASADDDSNETDEVVADTVSQTTKAADDTKEDTSEDDKDSTEDDETAEDKADSDESVEDDSTKSDEDRLMEDLTLEYEIPKNLRDRSHIAQLLHLDQEFDEKESAINTAGDFILKELKRIYDTAIKPLETLYKYRDLSNRHFGDPEIFSKPLVLFMGPWSGGKSSLINYLTDNEYKMTSLRTGAEPSPAYFNILMHGDVPEVLDGTQLAADWTFSGLQKFGQGLEDRIRGLKLPNKLLEKVNIVEIPGILEVRKQVSRLFPFNDACQWFIDRADIIFLVYDPSKLDVGPETEAILDQLKGREYQTRILLNKADIVKPEELLRVQSALIWNISPLMSSAQPPAMYTASLWSNPFTKGAPVRLLQAQERALLIDVRESIDKRIENKIASARRFAVRVRNHAKMVDCYLTTYYNHKTLFGNKKVISDQIIDNPQNYHIYEGLSTLTNISRYDLPDPDVYRDFFRLNPLYEFKKLSETCTYFRGCPIQKLDVAIAYDLPELVNKYKKRVEAEITAIEKNRDKNDSKEKS